MSIPIILASILLVVIDMLKSPDGFAGVEALPVIVGFLTAMITGYIAIKFMLKIVKKANYKWFSLYLVLMSIASLITALV